MGAGRFLRQVGCLRNGQLHPRSQLVAPHSAFQRVIARALGQMAAVQLGDCGKAGRLRRFIHAGCRTQVPHGRAAGLKRNPLMPGGEKAAGPVVGAAGRKRAAVGKDDERGQVIHLASQAVGDPSACRREAESAKPAVGFVGGRCVIAGTGPHRPDHGQFVGNVGQVGK
jgi:hypothetical protein